MESSKAILNAMAVPYHDRTKTYSQSLLSINMTIAQIYTWARRIPETPELTLQINDMVKQTAGS